MKLVIVAVGQKIPAWAQQACDSYLKRFSKELNVELVTVKTEQRRSKLLTTILKAEKEHILEAVNSRCNKNYSLVALDEHGISLTTVALTEKLQQWQQDGADVALVIGGPDGLDPELKRLATAKISLSSLTLPHALARVLLIEQLYRSWSLLNNHPYHRE